MTRPATVFFGCPVWQSGGWNGVFTPPGTPRPEMLTHYARTFTTVEGNTTFYALPTPETAQRWIDQTPTGFHFCFKVPRIISHEKALRGIEPDLAILVETLAPFAEAGRLGPTFLQLPPTADRSWFVDLTRFLEAWPASWPLAVEPRHPDYFDEGTLEARFDRLLSERGQHRVILDSRALFSRPARTEAEETAWRRKPRSPHRTTVTGGTAFVRLIGRDDVTEAEPYLIAWAETVASWRAAGVTVYLFTHAPDDAFAPTMARRFHHHLAAADPTVGPATVWPIERGAPGQGLLF